MAAIRTLASLPVLALPVAVFYARKRLYGDADPFFAFAALILCFGFMTVLGFASYMISLAVLMIAVTEWLVLMAKTDAGESTISQEACTAILAALVTAIGSIEHLAQCRNDSLDARVVWRHPVAHQAVRGRQLVEQVDLYVEVTLCLDHEVGRIDARGPRSDDRETHLVQDIVPFALSPGAPALRSPPGRNRPRTSLVADHRLAATFFSTLAGDD